MLNFTRWRHRHTVLLLSVCAYFGIRFVEFALSIVFKDIKTTLDISTFVIGLAVATSTITYAMVQLPSGSFGDRFGHRSVVLASLGLTGVASLLLAASPSALFILLGMAVIGLVSGAYYSPATVLLTDRFSETGRAIGIHRLGAQAVGITGPIVGVLGAMFNWRVVLLAGGIIPLFVFLGYRALVRPTASSTSEVSLSEQMGPKTLSLLTRPSIAFSTFVAAFAQFVDTATFSFLPLLLREFHGLGIEVAGGLFTLYFVSVALSQPVAGWLSDRFNRDVVIVGALLVTIVGYLLLAMRPPFGGIIVGVACIGLGMGWGPPLQARLMDDLTDDEQGAGFGLVRTIYIGFASLNGLVVGGAASLWGWGAGITVILVSLVVATAPFLLRRMVQFERGTASLFS